MAGSSYKIPGRVLATMKPLNVALQMFIKRATAVHGDTLPKECKQFISQVISHSSNFSKMPAALISLLDGYEEKLRLHPQYILISNKVMQLLLKNKFELLEDFLLIILTYFLPEDGRIIHDDWIMMIFLVTSDVLLKILETEGVPTAMRYMLTMETTLTPTSRTPRFTVGPWLFHRWVSNAKDKLLDANRQPSLIADMNYLDLDEVPPPHKVIPQYSHHWQTAFTSYEEKLDLTNLFEMEELDTADTISSFVLDLITRKVDWHTMNRFETKIGKPERFTYRPLGIAMRSLYNRMSTEDEYKKLWAKTHSFIQTKNTAEERIDAFCTILMNFILPSQPPISPLLIMTSCSLTADLVVSLIRQMEFSEAMQVLQMTLQQVFLKEEWKNAMKAVCKTLTNNDYSKTTSFLFFTNELNFQTEEDAACTSISSPTTNTETSSTKNLASRKSPTHKRNKSTKEKPWESYMTHFRLLAKPQPKGKPETYPLKQLVEYKTARNTSSETYEVPTASLQGTLIHLPEAFFKATYGICDTTLTSASPSTVQAREREPASTLTVKNKQPRITLTGNTITPTTPAQLIFSQPQNTATFTSPADNNKNSQNPDDVLNLFEEDNVNNDSVNFEALMEFFDEQSSLIEQSNNNPVENSEYPISTNQNTDSLDDILPWPITDENLEILQQDESIPINEQSQNTFDDTFLALCQDEMGKYLQPEDLSPTQLSQPVELLQLNESIPMNEQQTWDISDEACLALYQDEMAKYLQAEDDVPHLAPSQPSGSQPRPELVIPEFLTTRNALTPPEEPKFPLNFDDDIWE